MHVELLSNGRLNETGRYSGQTFNRAVLVDFKWVVMNVKDTVTVLDYDVYKGKNIQGIEGIQGITWTLNAAGYVYNSQGASYLHQLVLPNKDKLFSVDHINQHVLDNRKCNLRLATQSEQNANRPQRSDKIGPCAELVERGITRFPRGIRYDKGMQRYVVEIADNATMNATRSTKMDHIAKFKDALTIYIAQSERGNRDNHDDALGRKELANEYMTILDAAHAFDPSMNCNGISRGSQSRQGNNTYDDVAYANRLLNMLSDVQVKKGPANIQWSEHDFPQFGAIGRTKGDTFTLYDAAMKSQLAPLNWETSGSVPRYNKRSLGTHIWTNIMKREIPDGHIVTQLSCDGYDVRSANLYLLKRDMAYRTTPNEWVIPEGVDLGTPGMGYSFLPRGIVVNKTKVMIVQSGNLRPGECGADANGLWNKSRNKTNTDALVKQAIKILQDTHGQAAFNESNNTYQYLMSSYRMARL